MIEVIGNYGNEAMNDGAIEMVVSHGLNDGTYTYYNNLRAKYRLCDTVKLQLLVKS